MKTILLFLMSLDFSVYHLKINPVTSVTKDVFYPEAIKILKSLKFISNTSFVVTVGEDAYLGCTTENPSQALSQISWQRPEGVNFYVFTPENGAEAVNEFGKRVKFNRIGNWDGSIVIQNACLSDEGVYICIFTIFPSGPFHFSVTLTVQVKPVLTVSTEGLTEESHRETHIATCRVEHGKPEATITWETPFPKHKSVETSLMNEDCTITIESQLRAIPTRSEHGQEVHCIVEHPTFQKPEVASARLNIQYPPNLTVKQLNPDALIFQCEADANPPVEEYVWTRESGSLPNCATVTGAQLQFSTKSSDVNGMYHCEAKTHNTSARAQLYLQIYDSWNYPGLVILGIVTIAVLCIFPKLLWSNSLPRWLTRHLTMED
ncbi:nectin-1 [Amia ocellicauda]|uniref:nectin-1 n=1 Tax=Amia ocellicauda TaxID=2972642 RepID=UPI0034649BA5